MHTERERARHSKSSVRLRACCQLLTVLAVSLPAPISEAADLVHQFNLSGTLVDALGTGVTLQSHPNTATSGFGADGWWWTATSSPGGGLILTTNHLTNPLDYSLGFRVEFDQVDTGGGGGGSAYRKLLSFKDAADDNGLYFHSANMVFYPFGANVAITYSPSTFYDFVFSRSAADSKIRVFVVEGGGTVTKVYEEDDSGQDAVPVDTGGGLYQFGLFMDDTHTAGEWTSGGACKSIRVWNGPLIEAEVGDALSDASTGSATNVTSESATLNGTANPKGSATTVTFEYGLTTAYGTEVAADQSPAGGTSVAAMSRSISGLSAGTVYHYRVKAVNAGGTIYGSDRTLTTSTTVTASVGSASFVSGGAAVVVDSGLAISGSTISGAKISITGGFASGDVLSYTGSLPGGVSASYSSTTGILTFSGTTTAANWQTLLRTVTFSTTSGSLSTRTVAFTVGAAIPFNDNGHFYEYVASANIIWSNAKTAADSRTLFGLQGYLATITSQAENDFIRQKLGADAWIGGSDETVEGVWRWVTGPEAGTQFAAGSVSHGGQFANWNTGEPNNCCGGEHYTEIYSTDGVGKWNDLGAASQLAGYVVEYGDMVGDPTVEITASRNVSIVVAPTVTTTAVSNVTLETAASGGNVTSDGGATVTARGICWNTGGTPIITDSTCPDATGGTGVFVSSLSGLSPGTTYYVRAYATNVAGTGYGAQRTFTTASSITLSSGQEIYALGDPAVVVDSSLVIRGSTFSGFVVSIADGFRAGDTLGYNGSLPAGVTASFSTSKGVLTFSGTASASEWQTLARSVTFSTTSSNLSTRSISFTLGGALPSTDTGHFYEFVADTVSNWTTAKSLAESRTLFGLQGYLATITSQAEQDFITQKVSGVAWLGATDAFAQINTAVGSALYANQAASEGKWYWVTGPEMGTQFASSNYVATAVNNSFLNWDDLEPNNAGAAEHYCQMMDWTTPAGRWNDIPNTGGTDKYSKQGYVVEYGGLPSEPTLQITAAKPVLVTPADLCPEDPSKTTPGVCGCGVADTDTDGDGTSDCNDACPGDPTKTELGVCGCGVADTDTDGDGTLDCNEQCPQDPVKTAPGACGCGVADTDADGDDTPDCIDGCPNDPSKVKPGLFGCGVAEVDTDGDGVPDTTDACPNDPNKTRPGVLGCGVAEADADGDGVPDSLDNCPNDPNKVNPGTLGCGVPESPDLQIAITLGAGQQGSGGTSVHVGQELQSHVLVTNVGNGGATNVWVTIPLPSGMEFVSISIGFVSTGQTVPANVVVESGRISFPVGDVPAGYHVEADLVLRAKAAGEVTLTPQTISDETQQPVTGAPAAAQVADIYDRITTRTTYPALCGAAGAAPFLLTMILLALVRRRP